MWGKQGDARAWDAGKGDEEEEAEEEEDEDSVGSDDSSDDDDVADLLVSRPAKSRGDRAKFEVAVGSMFKQAKEPAGADRAVEEVEMQWDDEGGANMAGGAKSSSKEKRRKDRRK